ncbi:hypothetical protein [Anaerophilus nitritogenes]|uniref:hypothetical protein n=1 Tax=Anaerophilus nitritogenes TaxID=2498136 RepID=UPI00101BE490|nr:hypothetical protein [Anaerophilus nitritogenes]
MDKTGKLLHPFLTEKNTLENMEIGDIISCEYTASSGQCGNLNNLGKATKDLIPVTGSATPDGSFYFIKADEGLYIADRVVQHSISWDTLDKGGFIEGRLFSLIPKLTSSNDKGFNISCSKMYSELWDAFHLFDKNSLDGSENSWSPAGLNNDWVIIDFPFSLVLAEYIYTITSSGREKYRTSDPSSWEVYGSNDKGVTWELLDSVSNEPVFGIKETRSFYFQTTKNYNSIKFVFTDRTNKSYPDMIISEIDLYSTKCLVRSLSGGVAYIDENGNLSLKDKGLGAFPKNNEYAKYIINSKLGDIWNTNIKSWVKDTPSINIGYSRERVCLDTTFNKLLGTTVNTEVGFRPVLQLKHPTQKTLWY